MPNIEQGRIVWAELPSSDGTQKKRRPAVIITPTADIVPGQTFSVVALTTNFPNTLPPDHVKIPWKSDGNIATCLRQSTVAVCTWIVPIEACDIQQFGGVVPAKEMLEIAKIIKQKDDGAGEPPAAE